MRKDLHSNPPSADLDSSTDSHNGANLRISSSEGIMYEPREDSAMRGIKYIKEDVESH
jgi:hypothetical protein